MNDFYAREIALLIRKNEGLEAERREVKKFADWILKEVCWVNANHTALSELEAELRQRLKAIGLYD